MGRNDSPSSKLIHLPSVTEGPLEVRDSGNTCLLPCATGFQSSLANGTIVLYSFGDCVCTKIIMEMEGTINLSFQFTVPTHFLPSCGENQPFVVMRHLNTDN